MCVCNCKCTADDCPYSHVSQDKVNALSAPMEVKGGISPAVATTLDNVHRAKANGQEKMQI